MRRWCGKTPHKTEKDARRHMIHLLSKQGKRYGKINVYHCKICDRWHFGHRPDRGSRQKDMPRAKIVTKETVHG